MAETTFDLAALFEQTFGYRTTAFSPQFTPPAGYGAQRVEVSTTGSPYYAQDELSGEYFMPVSLVYSQSTAGSTAGTSETWDLPYPVISISARKTIIETVLTERSGTVKELVNLQGYDIVIKGFIIDAGGNFPESKVTRLRSIYEQSTAISIKCPLTDIFLLRPDRSGSDKVVIRELKLPMVVGMKNVRPYEIHLSSDEPFSLIAIA